MDDVDVPDGAAVAARYRSTTFAAMYLLAEWGDRLEAPGNGQLDAPAFYRRTATLAAGWLASLGVRPLTWCDVGGATGRFLSEVLAGIDSLVEGTLVEPSEVLSDWARRLLVPEHQVGRDPIDVPLPGTALRPRTVSVPPAQWPEPVEGVAVVTATAEAVAATGVTFDAVSCLNVLDRVADPRGLVEVLGQLLQPGGLLLLACPFDFKEHFTPRAEWFADLVDVLDDRWRVVGSADVPYVFRQYDRRSNTYLSQVVAAVSLG